MRFEWNAEKDEQYLLKRGFRFETATLVFNGLHALTQREESVNDEERWITLGSVSLDTILFVVHTYHEHNGEDTVRIISARRATPRERRGYEEAKQDAKKRHRRYRRHERRGN